MLSSVACMWFVCGFGVYSKLTYDIYHCCVYTMVEDTPLESVTLTFKVMHL